MSGTIPPLEKFFLLASKYSFCSSLFFAAILKENLEIKKKKRKKKQKLNKKQKQKKTKKRAMTQKGHLLIICLTESIKGVLHLLPQN